MKIRPLDAERDLDGYLRVIHQCERFPRTAAEWWERQRRAGPDAFRRYLVGELSGEIVAAAALLDHEMALNTVGARLVVDAAHRGRGRGGAMVAAMTALLAERDPAPDAVDVRLRDDDPAALAWAERRGFRLRNRSIRSRLDLARFDPRAHRSALARAEGAGLRFETPDDEDRLYGLYARLVRDAPDGLEPPSREWFRRHLEHPGALSLVAVAGETPVGLAIATAGEDGGAWNDFTGVAPGHRGQGIARVLKVLVAERLADGGCGWIETTNNALNAPMLAVNRALGYRPVDGVLFLRRALR